MRVEIEHRFGGHCGGASEWEIRPERWDDAFPVLPSIRRIETGRNTIFLPQGAARKHARKIAAYLRQGRKPEAFRDVLRRASRAGVWAAEHGHEYDAAQMRIDERLRSVSLPDPAFSRMVGRIAREEYARVPRCPW